MPVLSRRSAMIALAAGALRVSTLPRRALAAPTSKPLPPLPLDFAVAEVREGGPLVRDRGWIESQVAEAEALLGPLGLHGVCVGVRAMNARHANLETREDRDSLAEEVRPGVLNVFVVDTLMDVDEPPRMRRGVHWRERAHPATRYVILASEAMPAVLAHEMGHYFGCGHSRAVDDLMSYERSGGPLSLDPWEKQVIEQGAHRAFASGELRPADRL